jgi:hypothetical protein
MTVFSQHRTSAQNIRGEHQDEATDLSRDGFGCIGKLGTCGASLLAGGTMASYEVLGSGGCMIGNMLFSNFAYVGTSQGQGTTVTDTQVLLTPQIANLGIVFSSTGWTVQRATPSTSSFVDSTISFVASVIGGTVLINDGTLTLSSFAVSGTGFGHISETIGATSLQVDTGGPTVSHQVFAPVNSVTVSKDVRVTVPAGTPSRALLRSTVLRRISPKLLSP